MGKIATNSEVNSKVGSSLSPAVKCLTKSEILATGVAVINGTYLNSQTVQLDDISKKPAELSKVVEIISLNQTYSYVSLEFEGGGNPKITKIYAVAGNSCTVQFTGSIPFNCIVKNISMYPQSGGVGYSGYQCDSQGNVITSQLWGVRTTKIYITNAPK